MDKISSFFEACESGKIIDAKDLLRQLDMSSLVGKKTREGRTCFHVAVISGDPDLLRELAEKLRHSGLINIIKQADEMGDTALHLAVRIDRVDLMKRLVDLDPNLCDCKTKGGDTPLKLAISLGFEEAVEFLITGTVNALHDIVELNQVKLLENLIKHSKENKLDLSKLINQRYQPATNPPDRGNSGTNPSDNEGNCAANLDNVRPFDGEDQHPKEKSPTNAWGDGGDMPSQSAERNKNKADDKYSTNTTDHKGNIDTDTQHDLPIVRLGDAPLHIAARNKYEHMVNLLLKVRGVDKLARNSENKTPFEVAREVMQYHESFRIIRKLAYYRSKPKPFMYCAPQVSHNKLMMARKIVSAAYETRRNAELVVAALLAAMTCAAAFTVPGGFESDNKKIEELGSPSLIHLVSFKLFLVFDCIAFFLSLFVCIMWEMSSELTTGDKMLFMTVNSLVVCCSFGFTAYGFMCAVYAMLARKVKTFSWVVLGSLIGITLCGVLAFIHQSVQFAVTRARFHRLCGVSCFVDDIVEKVWSGAECFGLLKLCRSGDEVSHDLITGHAKFRGQHHEHEHTQNNSHSSPSCCFNHV